MDEQGLHPWPLASQCHNSLQDHNTVAEAVIPVQIIVDRPL